MISALRPPPLFPRLPIDYVDKIFGKAEGIGAGPTPTATWALIWKPGAAFQFFPSSFPPFSSDRGYRGKRGTVIRIDRSMLRGNSEMVLGDHDGLNFCGVVNGLLFKF